MELTEKSISCIKVLFIGDQGVGKSSIIKLLSNSKFDSNYDNNKNEIECKRIYSIYKKKELCIYTLKIHINSNQFKIYKNLLLSVNIIFYIFDLTNEVSFYNILKIYDIINKDIPIYLVGNKSDLERKINVNTLKDFILEKNLEYFEISTINYCNFNIIFEKIYSFDNKYFTEICNYDKKRALFSNNSFKIILLGDSTVGKSSFFTRYFDDSFDEFMLSTVGI
jgi:GTPase SAR1 family protein